MDNAQEKAKQESNGDNNVSLAKQTCQQKRTCRMTQEAI